MDLLKGNCILTAFCGIFLPLKRISIRERMLEEVKRVLRKYLVKYCEGFGRVSGES